MKSNTAPGRGVAAAMCRGYDVPAISSVDRALVRPQQC
jgi:hypothetical protein